MATSLRDLMNRMGHDSMHAALIYQHATQGADRKIADAMEVLIQGAAHETGDDEGPDGAATGNPSAGR